MPPLRLTAIAVLMMALALQLAAVAGIKLQAKHTSMATGMLQAETQAQAGARSQIKAESGSTRPSLDMFRNPLDPLPPKLVYAQEQLQWARRIRRQRGGLLSRYTPNLGQDSTLESARTSMTRNPNTRSSLWQSATTAQEMNGGGLFGRYEAEAAKLLAQQKAGQSGDLQPAGMGVGGFGNAATPAMTAELRAPGAGQLRMPFRPDLAFLHANGAGYPPPVGEMAYLYNTMPMPGAGASLGEMAPAPAGIPGSQVWSPV